MQPEPTNSQSTRWTRLRIASCLFGMLLVIPLATATRLDPNPRGLGTHQQLGLPPCTSRVIFGLRCPACGMTTSWAHFVRGEWPSSAGVNLGGFLLALYTIGIVTICGRVTWTGDPPSLPMQKWATVILLAIAMVTMFDWARRMLAEGLL